MAKITGSTIGLKAGGIDVDAIVKALVDAERIPQIKLKDRQAEIQKRLDSANLIKADFETMRKTAATLMTEGIVKMKASVSDTAAAAATASAGAATGTMSFTVDQLASTHGLRTANAATSASTVVTSAATMGVSTSLGALGVSAVGVDADMSAGKYAVRVVQSSAGASLSSAALGTTMLSSPATLQLSVNGVAKTATVAAGTYTPSGLVSAVQTALNSQFPNGTAVGFDAGGGLRISTASEGSAASLAITGGTLLAAIGMATGSATGTDGIVKLGSSNVIAGSSSDLTATVAGTPIAASTTITASNQTLQMTVNGTARTVTLATGTYDRSGLATALQTAINQSIPVVTQAPATATLDATNALRLTAPVNGASATIAITGGTALTALGLSAGARAATATVTSAGAGATVGPDALAGAALTLSGGLRAGAGSLSVISTGDRTLGGVAAAINAADAGIAASAVKQSEGNWLLQLGAKSSGSQSRMMIDSSLFSSIGGLIETSAAKDAKITIGSGSGAYSVTASSSSFTGVMPGVTLTAKAVSTTPVTVSVGRDEDFTADNVEALVMSANLVLGQIKEQTTYDAAKRIAQPLTNESGIRNLAGRIRTLVTDAVASAGGYTSGSQVGLITAQDGTISFDRDKFKAALSASQSGVEGIFGRSGTGSPGLTFAAAADTTTAGTYDVVITQAATRASSDALFVGGVSTSTVMAVKLGSVTAKATLTAGATPAMVAASLNTALAAAGLKVNAEVSGGGVKLTASDFGSAGNFSVNTDVNGTGTWTSVTGADVAGTIAGVVAAGVGNRLWLSDVSASKAKGLKIDVGEGVTGTKTFTYSPGIAGRLAGLANEINADSGTMKVITGGYNTRINDLTKQIDAIELKLTDASSGKEAKLRAQWAAVQSNLATLQSKQDWIKGQVDAMNATK